MSNHTNSQHRRVQVADRRQLVPMLGIIVIAHECTYEDCALRTCQSLPRTSAKRFFNDWIQIDIAADQTKFTPMTVDKIARFM